MASSRYYYIEAKEINRKHDYTVKVNGKGPEITVKTIKKRIVENERDIIKFVRENGDITFCERLDGSTGPYYSKDRIFHYNRHSDELLSAASWKYKAPFIFTSCVDISDDDDDDNVNTMNLDNTTDLDNTIISNESGRRDSLLDTTDEDQESDYSLENDDSINDNNNNVNNNNNNKSRKKKHNNHQKQTLIKSRNRFGLSPSHNTNNNNSNNNSYRRQSPPTIPFYVYEDKKATIDKWIAVFKRKQNDPNLSKKIQSNIVKALQDIKDAERLKSVPVKVYDAINDLFVSLLFETDLNDSTQQQYTPDTKILSLPNESKIDYNNVPKKSDQADHIKMYGDKNVITYCIGCDMNIKDDEPMNSNDNKKNKQHKVMIHWNYAIFNDQRSDHLSVKDKYKCEFCGNSFPNGILRDNHKRYKHRAVTRDDSIVNLKCKHQHHSEDCNPKTCRSSGDEQCNCILIICNQPMYASWNGQKGKYVAMCTDKRCRHNYVPQKCKNNNDSTIKGCVCGAQRLCDWAKINYSIKSKQQIEEQYNHNNIDNNNDLNQSEYTNDINDEQNQNNNAAPNPQNQNQNSNGCGHSNHSYKLERDEETKKPIFLFCDKCGDVKYV